jgi:hypothetical protein
MAIAVGTLRVTSACAWTTLSGNTHAPLKTATLRYPGVAIVRRPRQSGALPKSRSPSS